MEHHILTNADFTEAVEGVRLALGASGEKTSVQYFTIEPGAEVPKHSHPHEQAGLITQGQLTFRFEDDADIVVKAGESYVFEGEKVHSAVNDGDETVTGIDVFSPPRTDPDWAE